MNRNRALSLSYELWARFFVDTFYLCPKTKKRQHSDNQKVSVLVCDPDGTRTFGFGYAGINHNTLKIKFLKN